MELSDSIDRLRSYAIAERIKLVAADLTSGRDEFRNIDAFELADLLEVPIPPDGSWNFYITQKVDTFEAYVSSLGIEGIADKIDFIDPLSILALTQTGPEISIQCVNEEGYLSITKRLQTNAPDADEKFTKDEKEAIRLACAYYDLDSNRSNGVKGRAKINVETNMGDLIFDAAIEEDGECIELLSPYQLRDALRSTRDGCDEPFLCDAW